MACGSTCSVWQFTTAKIYTEEKFRDYFNTALAERGAEKSYPFAIYDKKKQQYAGCTRYGNIDVHHKKVEIGWTWIHPNLQGTGFNKFCKFLLLQYGFETMQLNRIELKTSALNLKSQRAMLKLGAVKEGVLRQNMINDDGTVRDTMYFSFIKQEWPQIRDTIFKEFI